jgi:glycerol-3-phosphate acyltransferase PlsX
MVKLYSEFMKGAFKSSALAKLGYVFAKQALQKVRERTDPRRYNGAMLLGLGGVVVKSHGGTDGFGFGNAIGVAADMVAQSINQRIRDELAKVTTLDIPSPPAASASA